MAALKRITTRATRPSPKALVRRPRSVDRIAHHLRGAAECDTSRCAACDHSRSQKDGVVVTLRVRSGFETLDRPRT
jgi:hypothetical protein